MDQTHLCIKNDFQKHSHSQRTEKQTDLQGLYNHMRWNRSYIEWQQRLRKTLSPKRSAKFDSIQRRYTQEKWSIKQKQQSWKRLFDVADL